MMKKSNKLSLRKKADQIFSRFIRQRDRNNMGEGTCYTCPNRGEWKRFQNGHFVPRQYLAMRYDEVNNHSQCYACNMLYNGQPSKYAVRLEKDYGTGTVERLENLRQQIISNFNYQKIIDIYTEKCVSLGYEV